MDNIMKELWVDKTLVLANEMVAASLLKAVDVMTAREQLKRHLRTTPEGFALVPVGVAALHTNMKTTTSTQPDWHDAPTCAGDWLCDEGRHNVTDWRAIRVTPRLATANARDLWVNGSLYYGPIPQYKKAPDATP